MNPINTHGLSPFFLTPSHEIISNILAPSPPFTPKNHLKHFQETRPSNAVLIRVWFKFHTSTLFFFSISFFHFLFLYPWSILKLIHVPILSLRSLIVYWKSEKKVRNPWPHSSYFFLSIIIMLYPSLKVIVVPLFFILGIAS